MYRKFTFKIVLFAIVLIKIAFRVIINKMNMNSFIAGTSCSDNLTMNHHMVPRGLLIVVSVSLIVP